MESKKQFEKKLEGVRKRDGWIDTTGGAPLRFTAFRVYVGGRRQVEATRQAILKGDRAWDKQSELVIPKPFDVLEGAMAAFLDGYAQSIVRFDRESITPVLVVFKLRHIEFEDLGKITLRKLSDVTTNLTVDVPDPSTAWEAAAHLLKWGNHLSAQELSTRAWCPGDWYPDDWSRQKRQEWGISLFPQERQALEDFVNQNKTQRDEGELFISTDNSHWFESSPSQERAVKLQLLQEKLDAARDELDEVRKRLQQEIAQRFLARLGKEPQAAPIKKGTTPGKSSNPKPQTRIQAAIKQLSVNRLENIKKTGKVPDLNAALSELGEATISRKKLKEHASDLLAKWQIKSYRAVWRYDDEKEVWEVSE